MAKNAITDYDTDPNNNTDVGGIEIEGSDNVANFDNALRQIMAHLKTEHDAVYALLGDNLIINGGFDVNQEEVSGTVVLTSGDYGHDMWKAGSSGCTYTFATVNNVTTITISAGSLQQVIEGDFLDSGTHCLAWTGTAQGKIGAGSYGSTGVTGTVTGGTNLTIEFNTGTLTNVSLIEGSIAGNYKRRLLPTEKRLCQRYFQTGFVDGHVNGSIYNFAGGLGSSAQKLHVEMRDTPTGSIGTTTNVVDIIGVWTGTPTTLTFDGITKTSFRLNVDVPTTVSDPYLWTLNDTNFHILQFDARL